MKHGGISHQLHLKAQKRHLQPGYSLFLFFLCFVLHGIPQTLHFLQIIMFLISSFSSIMSSSKPEKSHALHHNPSRLSLIRVAGDGRCLFRAVVYGACLRSGDPSPSHAKQKQLADDLRNKVVDEFIKRRADTEWFVEGDFETYTGQMRKPHIWGGEPELLMSSHVLRMPIRVVMEDKKKGGVKVIAEYGEEYGKESPIQVMYHGYGHYDVLHTNSSSSSSSSSSSFSHS